nr:YebC/PmpR family DNA-binding transcriptional regulator [Phycisphaerae bacterium]
LITVGTSSAKEEDLMDLVLGAGAEDMNTSGDVYEITCEPTAFESIKKALEEKGIPVTLAEISMLPKSTVSVTDPNTARKIINLMESIDDHDDVQNAYSNFDIPAEVIAQVSS